MCVRFCVRLLTACGNRRRDDDSAPIHRDVRSMQRDKNPKILWQWHASEPTFEQFGDFVQRAPFSQWSCSFIWQMKINRLRTNLAHFIVIPLISRRRFSFRFFFALFLWKIIKLLYCFTSASTLRTHSGGDSSSRNTIHSFRMNVRSNSEEVINLFGIHIGECELGRAQCALVHASNRCIN